MLKGVSNLAQLVRATAPASSAGLGLMVDIERIAPDPEQPRKVFTEESLQAMAATIRAQGVIQPLVVCPSPTTMGDYLLIAGERRWRASRIAELTQVPVVVRKVDAVVRLALQLIENLDRQDLSVQEEATAVRRLIDLGHSQKEVATFLGKTKSWVSLRYKLASNMHTVEKFLIEDRTRDVDLLCLLVDLSNDAPQVFADFLDGDRKVNVTRSAVRGALDVAHGKTAPTPHPDPLPPAFTEDQVIDGASNTDAGIGRACLFDHGNGTTQAGSPVAGPSDETNPASEFVPALPSIQAGNPTSPRAARRRAVATTVAPTDAEGVKRIVESILKLDATVVPPASDAPGQLSIFFADYTALDVLVIALSSITPLPD